MPTAPRPRPAAYFGVSIRDVDLSEAAYLAGLIRSPESADATRDPERATFRRDSVLDGMLDEEWITPAEHDAATAVSLGDQVVERSARDGLTMLRGDDDGSTYYVEYVRRLLYKKYGAERVNGGGLRVYTALNPTLQREAYDAVWGFLDQPDDPAGALVSVDDLGRVVAMVGGRDFDASQVNLALGAAAGGSGRQPGSSFKPIVLATAIDQGISLESRFRNQNEIVFPKANGGQDWKVSNYSPGAEGIVDLLEATRVSSNTVFAQLMLEVGPAKVVKMAHELGISSDIPTVNSLVLGAGEVSVLDMASAYSTFARRGEAIEPDHHHQGRAGRRRRREGAGDGVHQVRPGPRARHGRRGRLRPAPGRAGRHRHGGQLRRARGRQDRHHPGLPRRLVRRASPPSSPRRSGWATPIPTRTASPGS